MTRRTLFALLAWPALAWVRRAAASPLPPSAFEVERLAANHPGGVVSKCARRYRVHATISLMSVPLFSKADVGGACVMVEQVASANSRTTVLQFCGGSWPSRVRGFNRFGMTQEAVREERASVLASAYASYITVSAEKNLEQARQSFLESSPAMTIAVTHGAATPGRYTSALDHLTVPADYEWSNCPQLMEEIRGRVSEPAGIAEGESAPAALPTFLYAVRSALRTGAESSSCTFIHNARLYRLRSRMSEAGDLTMLAGWISPQGSDHESEFRLWFDRRDPAELPVRIEFKPKNFLRLVFEHDRSAGGPTLRSLIPSEQA